MAHSIKIDNGKETKWPSRPNINAKAHEENSKSELVPIYKFTQEMIDTVGNGISAIEHYESLGLVEGEWYLCKFVTKDGKEQSDYVRAIWNENTKQTIVLGGMFFYIADTFSYINESFAKTLSELPVFYKAKSIPFATTTEALSLGIESGAKAGQIPCVSEVDMVGRPTKWKIIDELIDEKYIPNISSDKVVFNSSTSESTKKFKLSIDDSGTITAVELT